MRAVSDSRASLSDPLPNCDPGGPSRSRRSATLPGGKEARSDSGFLLGDRAKSTSNTRRRRFDMARYGRRGAVRTDSAMCNTVAQGAVVCWVQNPRDDHPSHWNASRGVIVGRRHTWIFAAKSSHVKKEKRCTLYLPVSSAASPSVTELLGLLMDIALLMEHCSATVRFLWTRTTTNPNRA